MEKWQKLWILRHKPELIQETQCNCQLLSMLQTEGVLGPNDIDILETKGSSFGQMDKASLFYQILLSRSGAYNALVRCLFVCKQTAALERLQKGFESENISSPLKLCGIVLGPFASRNVNWSSLTSIEKSEILQSVVRYNGETRQLKNTHPIITEDVLHKIMLEHGNGYLFDRILSQEFSLVLDGIPAQTAHYITRSLSVTCYIKDKLFSFNCPDKFVFRNIEWSDLSKLAGPWPTDSSKHVLQSNIISVRFILLESEEDFGEICEIASDPVHLILHENGKFQLIKTFGSVKTIQRFLHKKQIKELRESEFIQLCIANVFKAVCICDTPGMGKSVFFAHIAKEIRKKSPDRLIFYICLPELVKQVLVLHAEQNLHADDVRRAISESCSDNEIGKNIVFELLAAESAQKDIFIDAYDEVVPTESNLLCATMVVNIIINDFKSTNLYVASRPHMQRNLEQAVGAICYKMLPFTKENQISFLSLYWQDERMTYSPEKLENYAFRCLDYLKNKLNDSERDIAGIPLQCRLLGEMYKKGARQTARSELLTPLPTTFGISSLYDMYHQLFKMRFESLPEYNEETLRCNHLLIAIHTLFPHLVEQFTDFLTPSTNITEEKLFRIGILEQVYCGERRFVHRTFAEFLVAEFVVKTIWNNKPHQQTPGSLWHTCLKLLFETILETLAKQKVSYSKFETSIEAAPREFVYPVICHFINSALTMENAIAACDESTYKEMVQHLQTFSFWNEEMLSNSVTACAKADYLNIFKVLKQLCQTTKGNHKLLTNKLDEILLLFAAKFSTKDLFAECVSLVENISSKSLIEMSFPKVSSAYSGTFTPLHVAVERGCYRIAEFLIKRYDQRLSELKCLVHICVACSLDDDTETVNQKCQIIKLILSKERSFLQPEEMNSERRSPLLLEHIHFQLLRLLLSQGVDWNATSEDGSTIAHYAPYYLSTHEYTELINLLVEKDAHRIFSLVDTHGRVPAQRALKNLKLATSTLDKLTQASANFNVNHTDNEGNSLIFYAVQGPGDAEILDYLISSRKANWRLTNRSKETVLHWAAFHGNLDALKYFIELGADPNALDECNRSPLYHVLIREPLDKNADLLLEALLNNKANLDIPNNKSLTLCQMATQKSIKINCTNGVYSVTKLPQVGLPPSSNASSEEVPTSSTQVLQTKTKKQQLSKTQETLNATTKHPGISPLSPQNSKHLEIPPEILEIPEDSD